MALTTLVKVQPTYGYLINYDDVDDIYYIVQEVCIEPEASVIQLTRAQMEDLAKDIADVLSARRNNLMVEQGTRNG